MEKYKQVAILAVKDEELYIKYCIENLIKQGFHIYILNDGSQDDTIKIAQQYLNKGVITIEEFNTGDTFNLMKVINKKEAIANSLDANWFMHTDADEIRLPHPPFKTISEALLKVESLGYNAVNFNRFDFMPEEGKDYVGRDYEKEMKYYYYHSSEPFSQIKLWRKIKGVNADFGISGGHRVHFEGIKIYPNPFILKHYIFLSKEHAIQKYTQKRKYSEENARKYGWHGFRVGFNEKNLQLPPLSRLKKLKNNNFDTSEPTPVNLFYTPEEKVLDSVKADLPKKEIVEEKEIIKDESVDFVKREQYLKKKVLLLEEQNRVFRSRTWRVFRFLQLKLRFLIIPFDIFMRISYIRKMQTLYRIYILLGIEGIKIILKQKVGDIDYPIDKFTVDYLHWQKVVEPKLFKKNSSKKLKKDLKFSIITPVWNVDPELLNKAIESVKAQTYSNWELCLYDDASTKQETLDYLHELENSSDNINIKFGKKNLNISLATNEALKMATGDYVLFLDNDDALSTFALSEIAYRINQKPETDVVYYDEDIMLMNDLRVKPILKPDWSPETLDSAMYIAHATYRKSLIDKLGGMRKGFEGSQDYDLILRARDMTDNIEHISKVLYHWRRIPGSTADFYEAKTTPQEAAIKALEESIKRRKLKAKVEKGLTAPSFRFKYKIEGNPLVSIIIPTRNMKEYLKRCIDSVLEKTNYKNYEIIIVNNQSDDEETLNYFENIRSESIRIVDFNDEFNYSAINNYAVGQAKAEHVLLLNNDTEVIDGDWLESMLEFSQQKEIGVVGALLYFPDDTIQHAGCAVGIGGVAGHLYKYSRMGEHHMNVSLDFPKIIHNVSAVTGACLMIKKDLYNKVSGLDEKFKVAFNDIDFCLKVSSLGLRNIYTPFASLYHFESKSRGYEYEDPTQQLRFENEVYRFKAKWEKFLVNGDPYYNSNFTLENEFGNLKNSY